MTPERVLRFEVPGRDVLDAMARAPLPFALEEQSSETSPAQETPANPSAPQTPEE